MKFLTARWEHLLLANYAVSPSVLQPFVPFGTQLDQYDGQTFVSLVAFLFARTRVLGLPIPFHTVFEEVNLRFYVSPRNQPHRRAVTFVREIVPRAAIPLIANKLFHEKYVAMQMDHSYHEKTYEYLWGNNLQYRFAGTITTAPAIPQSASLEEFITEHYWGYTKSPNGTIEYEVTHPQWATSQIDDYSLSVDFGKLYGDEFAFLSHESPHSVQYARGSAVTVSFPKRV